MVVGCFQTTFGRHQIVGQLSVSFLLGSLCWWGCSVNWIQESSPGMYQYFIKVVPSIYTDIRGASSPPTRHTDSLLSTTSSTSNAASDFLRSRQQCQQCGFRTMPAMLFQNSASNAVSEQCQQCCFRTVPAMLFQNSASNAVSEQCQQCCFRTVPAMLFQNSASNAVSEQCQQCCFRTVPAMLFQNSASNAVSDTVPAMLFQNSASNVFFTMLLHSA